METGWTDLAHQWQTLLGALIATGAVCIAVGVKRWRNGSRQLALLRAEEDDRRARRLHAMRADIPADLSTIITYAKECAGVCVKLLEGVRGQSISWVRENIEKQQLTVPSLPSREMSKLQDLIGVLDEKDAGPVTALVGCLHVQHAQLAEKVAVYNQPPQDGLTRVLTEHNVEHAITPTVEVYLRAFGMSEFAHGGTSRIGAQGFASRDVSNALRRLNVAEAISKDYERELCRTFAKERNAGTG